MAYFHCDRLLLSLQFSRKRQIHTIRVCKTKLLMLEQETRSVWTCFWNVSKTVCFFECFKIIEIKREKEKSIVRRNIRKATHTSWQKCVYDYITTSQITHFDFQTKSNVDFVTSVWIWEQRRHLHQPPRPQIASHIKLSLNYQQVTIMEVYARTRTVHIGLMFSSLLISNLKHSHMSGLFCLEVENTVWKFTVETNDT